MQLDAATKAAATAVFAQLEMVLTAGIECYLQQVVAEQDIPFQLTIISPLDRATLNAHEEIAWGEYDEFDSLESFREELCRHCD